MLEALDRKQNLQIFEIIIDLFIMICQKSFQNSSTDPIKMLFISNQNQKIEKKAVIFAFSDIENGTDLEPRTQRMNSDRFQDQDV